MSLPPWKTTLTCRDIWFGSDRVAGIRTLSPLLLSLFQKSVSADASQPVDFEPTIVGCTPFQNDLVLEERMAIGWC